MRRWGRALTQILCGYCKHRIIQQDEPVLYITIGQLKKEHRRCQDCAGEAPPELPANPVRGFRDSDPVSFTTIGSAAPTRTRGDLKKFAERWSPHNS